MSWSDHLQKFKDMVVEADPVPTVTPPSITILGVSPRSPFVVPVTSPPPAPMLTWEQKFSALQSLLIFSGSAALCMRKPGDWYVHLPGVNQRQKHVTSGGLQSGKTPVDAVEQAFDWATAQDFPLEIDNRGGGKRLVKWNGFMWADVDAPK